MKKIATNKAPAAIGPYSQAIQVDKFLFASGQIPINPTTGSVEAEGIEAQTRQVMKNIGGLLEAAGVSYDKVVKTGCFLADMGDFATFNEIYAKYFNAAMERYGDWCLRYYWGHEGAEEILQCMSNYKKARLEKVDGEVKVGFWDWGKR